MNESGRDYPGNNDSGKIDHDVSANNNCTNIYNCSPSVALAGVTNEADIITFYLNYGSNSHQSTEY